MQKVRWELEVVPFYGEVTSNFVQLIVFGYNPLRESLTIYCDFDWGVPLRVYWGNKPGTGPTGSYNRVVLQPGETMVFSRQGPLVWWGKVFLASATVGVNALASGGETVWERRGP